MKIGQRYTVYSIRAVKGGESKWVKAGTAFSNRDGSMNVYLDVLPLDGKLHIREANAENEQLMKDIPGEVKR